MDHSLPTSYLFGEIISSTLSSSCAVNHEFSGKMIIIGGGAAGLSAACLLHRKGIQCLISEASSRCGGRLKKLEHFADFPLNAGAEWLHDRKSFTGELIAKTGTKIYEDRSQVLY